MIFPKEWSTHKKLLFAMGLAGKAIEDTATGNPLTFLTDLAKPLKSLVANFLPVQTGSGDPSPENVRPITGWTGVTVNHAGKNLLDTSKRYMDSGNVLIIGSTTNAYNIYLKAGTYRLTVYYADGKGSTAYYRKEGASGIQLWGTGNNTATFTVSSEGYFKFYAYGPSLVSDDVISFMLSVGNEIGEYEPYNSTVYPVTWSESGTVYGGYVDMVTGEVWRTWKGVDLGLQSWSKRSENQNRQVWEAYFSDAKFESDGSGYIAYALSSQFSLTTQSGVWSVGKFAPSTASNNKVFIFVVPAESYASASECKEGMTGIQLVYELAEPVLITTLTPQQITAIKGNNTIWSDANGDCSVTYVKKG